MSYNSTMHKHSFSAGQLTYTLHVAGDVLLISLGGVPLCYWLEDEGYMSLEPGDRSNPTHPDMLPDAEAEALFGMLSRLAQ